MATRFDIFKVSFFYSSRTSDGFNFFLSQDEADIAASNYLEAQKEDETAEVEIEIIKVSNTAQGIADALNEYASHADNG